MGTRIDRTTTTQQTQAAPPQNASSLTASVANKIENAMDWLAGGGLVTAAAAAVTLPGLAPIGLATAGVALLADQLAAKVEKTHNPQAENDGIFSSIGKAISNFVNDEE